MRGEAILHPRRQADLAHVNEAGDDQHHGDDKEDPQRSATAANDPPEPAALWLCLRQWFGCDALGHRHHGTTPSAKKQFSFASDRSLMDRDYMSSKLTAGIAGLIVAVLAVLLVIQHQAQTKIRDENAALRQQLAQIDQLAAENQRLANLAAAASSAPAPTNDQFREVLKLRGEVGRLRQENKSVTAEIAKPTGPSTLSGVTANPEMMKVIRDQQKMAMGMVYKDFAKRANLPTEQANKGAHA